MARVGVLGSGGVGETIANGLLAHGHEVMRGSREPSKLSGWKAGAGTRARTGTPAETAEFGAIVVFAVKGAAAEEALDLVGPARLAGKTVIDTTNPIDDETAPQNGVLALFTTSRESLMERLQAAAPRAHFVKAFSCVGQGLMVDPKLEGGKPTMFLCGNDEGAKREVEEILEDFGWEWADMGGAEAARAIEPLAVLWCIPGFREDEWAHAFKLLR